MVPFVSFYPATSCSVDVLIYVGFSYLSFATVMKQRWYKCFQNVINAPSTFGTSLSSVSVHTGSMSFLCRYQVHARPYLRILATFSNHTGITYKGPNIKTRK